MDVKGNDLYLGVICVVERSPDDICGGVGDAEVKDRSPSAHDLRPKCVGNHGLYLDGVCKCCCFVGQ